ncbi:hypothetical protein VPHD530_0018 [Vibrio phage D530]
MLFFSHKYCVQWVVPHKLQTSEFIDLFTSQSKQIRGVYFDSQAYSFILETDSQDTVNKFVRLCEDYK